jgi:D-alanyl-D-alanine carboxypeptidase/D-alanyl-D-alanine-endopeptidase (penicillin-binding protein 4)
VRESPELERAIAANEFTFFPDATTKAGPWYVPIHFGKGVTAALLADTLKRPVTEVRLPLPAQAAVLRSVPADSVYKVMMQESDNFLAEQLLLACAMQVGDSLYGETAIRYAKKNLLFDLPDEPRWVDGSGLSRYNLFTPRSIVRLWEKIYTLVPRERLLPLLATGGQAGTIKNYYKADKPYVFGKTGTLSNNHCLSGFVVTEKGRTLIFSYMNSNFVSPTHEVRTYMENILDHIRRRY